jgi:hypothetical protein
MIGFAGFRRFEHLKGRTDPTALPQTPSGGFTQLLGHQSSSFVTNWMFSKPLSN